MDFFIIKRETRQSLIAYISKCQRLCAHQCIVQVIAPNKLLHQLPSVLK